MEPKIIKWGVFNDERGALFFNNSFDISVVKRIYFIENKSTSLIRAWQGHKIEQRWFLATEGEFRLQFIKIDDWENPSKDLKIITVEIKSSTLDVVHLPAGFISSIQALKKNSKLMVMSDYFFGEIADEYRFPLDFFNH